MSVSTEDKVCFPKDGTSPRRRGPKRVGELFERALPAVWVAGPGLCVAVGRHTEESAYKRAVRIDLKDPYGIGRSCQCSGEQAEVAVRLRQ